MDGAKKNKKLITRRKRWGSYDPYSRHAGFIPPSIGGNNELPFPIDDVILNHPYHNPK